jgi:hypothetical protein
MTSFDPETQAALQLIRRARTPDAATIERAWAAMQVRIVDGPPPMDLGLDGTRRGIRPLLLATAAAALVVLAVGATRLAGEWTRSDDRGDAGLTSYEQTPPAVDEPAASPAPENLERASTSTVAPDEVEATAPTKPVQLPRVPRRTKSSTAAEPAGPSSSDLEAELRLLAQANAATREGRHADALRVLDQHAREFPRGQLAPERDYKRAKVTCELGQVEAARKLAKSFLRAYPRSPMRAKAGDICTEPTE